MRIAENTMFFFLMLLLAIPSLPVEGYGAIKIKDLPIRYILDAKERHYKNSNEEIDKYMFVHLTSGKIRKIVTDLKQSLGRRISREDLEWQLTRLYGHHWRESEGDKIRYYIPRERKNVLNYCKSRWKKRTLAETERDKRWEILWRRHILVRDHFKASLVDGSPPTPPDPTPPPPVLIPDLSGTWCSGSFYRLEITQQGQGFRVVFFDKNPSSQLQGHCQAQVILPSSEENVFKDLNSAQNKYILKGTLTWDHWKGENNNDLAPIGWNFGIWQLEPRKRLNFLRSPGRGGFTHDLSLRTWDVDLEDVGVWNGHMFQIEGLGSFYCPKPDWAEDIEWPQE